MTITRYRYQGSIIPTPWLPAYAPDLNPTEGVWSWMKRGLANTAVTASITSPTW